MLKFLKKMLSTVLLLGRCSEKARSKTTARSQTKQQLPRRRSSMPLSVRRALRKRLREQRQNSSLLGL